jgi:hypothetical protein
VAKTILLLLLCLFSGCSKPQSPFYVTPINGPVMEFDRVYVKDGFLNLGATVSISTARGTAYIEKDFSNVTDLCLLHPPKPEEPNPLTIDGLKEYRRKLAEYDRKYNAMVIFVDKTTLFALHDFDGYLICYSKRGREEIPLSNVWWITRTR